jgi:hypothetical protein
MMARVLCSREQVNRHTFGDLIHQATNYRNAQLWDLAKEAFKKAAFCQVQSEMCAILKICLTI